MTDKKVITADGSITFCSEKYDETYHSTSGALEEADKKYAEVCDVNRKKEIDILDICFGLGYNSAAAIDKFKGTRINIVGLENYDGIIHAIIELKENYPFKCKEKMFKLAKDKEYTDEKLSMNLIMGDARETIKKLESNSFDCVFLDPFSPKKCPELWSSEFFTEIYRVIRKNGIVATYSCARIVRDNLKKVGFEVKDGPTVGRRSPGTLAVKVGK